MNKDISEQFLYTYIPKAEQSRMEALPQECMLDHTFSRPFLKKMKRLLKYERAGTFGRFGLRLARGMAAVLVVMLLVNTLLMVTAKGYRERVFEIIQTVTEKFTAFFVEPGESGLPEQWEPAALAYVPEGFEIVEQFRDEMQNILIYQKGGQEIYYCQSPVGVGITYFDTEDALVQTIKIGEQTVYTIEEDDMIQVYWVAIPCEYMIISNAGRDEVLAAAASMME